jgi:hypothetical protein
MGIDVLRVNTHSFPKGYAFSLPVHWGVVSIASLAITVVEVILLLYNVSFVERVPFSLVKLGCR